MKEPQYAILWDMDGTLIDTFNMHVEAWVIAFAQHGLTIHKEDMLEHFGKNNHAIIPNFIPNTSDDFIQALSDEKEAIFCTLVPGNTKLYPGVLDWLAYFKTKGYTQCIASSAPMNNIDVLLDETQIRDYFSYFGSGANIPGKPDPALFLSIANDLFIHPDQCLVIEDAPPGVQAAIAAKMECVAITNSRQANELLNANLVIEAFTPATLKQAEALLLG